jgi:hypothetical protein
MAVSMSHRAALRRYVRFWVRTTSNVGESATCGWR